VDRRQFDRSWPNRLHGCQQGKCERCRRHRSDLG